MNCKYYQGFYVASLVSMLNGQIQHIDILKRLLLMILILGKSFNKSLNTKIFNKF